MVQNLTKERLFAIFDKIILFSLSVLILILPVAHTATIRATAIIIPTVLWFTKMVIERRVLFVRTPLDIPILLFLLTAVISIFTAVDPHYTIRAIRSDMLEPFLLFYLAVNNIKREDQAKTLFFFLCIGAAVMTVYGIFDFFIKGGSLAKHGLMANSLHTDGQYFSTYLTIIFPFLMLGIFYFKGWWRLPLISLTFLTAFSIYITHTRAAWIALYIGLLFIIFTMIKRKWIPILLTLGLFSSLLLIPKDALYHGEVKFLTKNIEEIGGTLTQRLYIWQWGIKEILKDPVKGIGFGRGSFAKKYAEHPENKYKLGHSHNAFVDLTLQTGIQGLVAFLFVIYGLSKLHWVKYKDGNKDFYTFFSLAALVMIVGYIVRNIFDSFLLDDPLLMFWLLNGIGISTLCRRQCL